jgi:hypothetical protein
VVVRSSTVKNLDHWIRVQTGGTSAQRRRTDLRCVRSEHVDQPSLDPEVSAWALILLECTGEVKTCEVRNREAILAVGAGKDTWQQISRFAES